MISSNKRLAKNTAFLYFRMLLIMCVQFFTVRITLKYLGVEDYGIYNVVCGVTNVFTFLTHTMTSASQRFLAYDLGIGDLRILKKTFDTFVSIFSLCGLLGVFILGIAGTWFIQDYLVIPEERMSAALFAFYFTLASLFVSIYTLPYNSLIIAHEDMKTFAYVSIVDSIIKLCIVYCLIIMPFDKLQLYSVLMLFANITPSILFISYCFRKYDEVSLKKDVDWRLSKKIIPFMSWNLLGGLSWMLCTQGLSIIINMFFGPIANAAKAISDKVNSSINGFTNNFMMAVQPQIVKSYAVEDISEMHRIIFMASRFSFYLMSILILPITINADSILGIWLEQHDHLTTVMLQLILLYSLMAALETPINQAIRATGRIRNYQLYVGLITIFVIPVAYLFFYQGCPAYYGYISLMIVYGLAFILRLYYLRKQVKITYSMYFKNVFGLCIGCLLVNVVLLLLMDIVLEKVNFHPLISWGVEVLIASITIIFVGLNKSEKDFIKNKIKKKLI